MGMEKNGRGQISTEIVVLIGLLLLLLIPLLLYAYGRANVATEDIAVQKAEFAASRLSSLADSVGYLGGAAAIVEEVEIPSNVRSVRIDAADPHDIVFDIDSTEGTKQIVKSSAFNLTSSGFGNITKAGTYFIKISALPAGSAAQVKLELD
jgi:type II secretory pathway pseudopilin PulG